jgi:hypothetical protein
MVGARGFEPPTPWSRTIWIENLNRFRGVAYGPDTRSFLRSNVPKLYREFGKQGGNDGRVLSSSLFGFFGLEASEGTTSFFQDFDRDSESFAFA